VIVLFTLRDFNFIVISIILIYVRKSYVIIKLSFSSSQRTCDSSILASVYQQRGQRGSIQESSGLGRRLTHTVGPVVFFFFNYCSQSIAATYRVYFPFFFYYIYHLNKLKRKKLIYYVYFLFYAYIL